MCCNAPPYELVFILQSGPLLMLHINKRAISLYTPTKASPVKRQHTLSLSTRSRNVSIKGGTLATAGRGRKYGCPQERNIHYGYPYKFNSLLHMSRLPCVCRCNMDAMEQPSQPQSLSQLVSKTSRTVVFPFLIGIVLVLDGLKLVTLNPGTQHVFQMNAFQFCQMIIGSYLFLFVISAAVTMGLGFLCIPMLRRLKAYQIIRKEGPSAHFSKSGTPTMGGLCFIFVGVTLSLCVTNFNSTHVNGIVRATILFGAIGLFDDTLSLIRKHNYGLPGWCKLCLQAIVGVWFYFWHKSTSLPTNFQWNTVLLPSPFIHWNIGNWYLPLTAFCFAAMSNGVNLTDGLDGLAAGTAAAAFSGMSIAAFNISPAVSVFGVLMAGACIGFLAHNSHKATVFMGDTGSLALGGALAATAVSTGMFLPLFICSGIFFVETVSVILQVGYKKLTKKLTGNTKKLFRMAPIHHHFELGGMEEPTIVAAAHFISCVLALIGGYIGYQMC